MRPPPRSQRCADTKHARNSSQSQQHAQHAGRRFANATRVRLWTTRSTYQIRDGEYGSSCRGLPADAASTPAWRNFMEQLLSKLPVVIALIAVLAFLAYTGTRLGPRF